MLARRMGRAQRNPSVSAAKRLRSQGLNPSYELMVCRKLVLPDRMELSTSPLPMECSTTELRQHARGPDRIGQEALNGAPILATSPQAAQALGCRQRPAANPRLASLSASIGGRTCAGSH